jgi:hypothetical protein
MGILGKIFLITVSWVISIGLAIFLSKPVYLTSEINLFIKWVDDLFQQSNEYSTLINRPSSKTIILPKKDFIDDVEQQKITIRDRNSNLNNIHVKYSINPHNYDHFEVGNQITCKNEPRLNFHASKDKFVDIAIYGKNLPIDFIANINNKLSHLHTIYSGLLSKQTLKIVKSGTYIYDSELLFSFVKEELDVPEYAGGFYSHKSNRSHILFTSQENTEIAAIHEAVHATNKANIGLMPRWLNEGLAEYIEQLTITKQRMRIVPKRKIELNNSQHNFLQLSVLVNSSQKDWNSILHTQLYDTAWAFIYFLMEDSNRKKQLKTMLYLERDNLCDKTNFFQTEQELIVLENLQKAFNQWILKSIKPHKLQI